MPSRHVHPPISFRPSEPLREWLTGYASRHGQSVRGVITEALEEFRVKHDREEGIDMEPLTTKIASEHLDRVLGDFDRAFRYKFMQPDKMAWHPISFPGLEYTYDGLLAPAMKANATQHLIDVLGQNGCVIRFRDGTDVNAGMHHVLWDQWTQAEIGNGRFIGRMFNDEGRIYQGCTADQAAKYALERIRAMGGEFYSCVTR